MKNLKLKIFIVSIVLVVIVLGGAQFLTRKLTTRRQILSITPIPTSSPGFESIITKIPEEIQVGVEIPALPKSFKIYQIKPAPFELFSPESAQVIAQNLGFTANAKVFISGNLYIYQEMGKTLSVDKIAGTINYSESFDSLTSGVISLDLAKTKVKGFFKTLGLDQEFFGWDKAEAKAYTLVDGIPRETATTPSMYFLELVPKFDLKGYDFLTTFPIFARVEKEGRIVGLSFWYPNLEESANEVEIKSFAEAQKEVREGEGSIVKVSSQEIERLNLTEADLAYFVPTDYLSDFSVPHFTKLIYVFSGDGVVVYLPAEQE